MMLNEWTVYTIYTNLVSAHDYLLLLIYSMGSLAFNNF